MRTGDGNESDKAVFGKILSNVKKQIKLDRIMVCDSALYSQENIQLISNLKWITRVPMTLKKTKEIIGSYLVGLTQFLSPNIAQTLCVRGKNQYDY